MQMTLVDEARFAKEHLLTHTLRRVSKVRLNKKHKDRHLRRRVVTTTSTAKQHAIIDRRRDSPPDCESAASTKRR